MLDPGILKTPICLDLEYLVEILGPDYGSRQHLWRVMIGLHMQTIGDRQGWERKLWKFQLWYWHGAFVQLYKVGVFLLVQESIQYSHDCYTIWSVYPVWGLPVCINVTVGECQEVQSMNMYAGMHLPRRLTLIHRLLNCCMNADPILSATAGHPTV